MIYLLHFDRPFHHARHYMGFCAEDGLEARQERHRAGHGAKLLAAVHSAGIAWRVARTWPLADRDQERRFKRRKNASQLCPLCKPRQGRKKGR